MILRRSRSRDVQALAARRLAALSEGFDRAEQPSISSTPDPASPHSGTDEAGLTPGRHADRTVRTTASGLRLPLRSQHLAVVAVAVAVASVVTGWLVLRSVPKAEPVELSSTRVAPDAVSTPSAGASSSTPSGGAPAPSPPATSLVVDVTGKVRRPGIVELPSGSRVVDALEAAGGPRPRADVSGLNLARLLVDGEQIVVGVAVPGGPAPVTPDAATEPGSATPMVNLNTATSAQLEELPGVGPVTAAAIIEWRTQHGAFSSIDELLEVSGIGDATLAEIRPFAQL